MSLAMQSVSAFLPQIQEPEVIFKQGMALSDIERVVILETLKRQNNNRTRAARVLGIGIRTLQRKIKEYRSHGLLLETV
jgi:transcriptional regulator with PAS, ATPase and Fis domain